jgi:hypothetical protein
MIALATTLPEHSNDGYVAAAYIVFLALVLIYVTIMSIRLGRVERKVRELNAQERERELTPVSTPHGGAHPGGHALKGADTQAGEKV